MSKYPSEPFTNYIEKVIDFRGRTPKKLGMDWGGGDIRALSANNVEMGKINFDKECYLGSDELYKKWMNRGDCSESDVVMTMEAPLGNIAQIPDDKKYILSQRTILFKTKKDKILNDYFYYLLSGNEFQRELQNNATGTTAKGIQQKKLLKIDISVPKSLGKQKKISAILKSVDRCISQTEEAIQKLQKIKTGFMQDLFTRGVDAKGKLRPSYEEKPELYKPSRLGMIPKEWTTDSLKALSVSGLQNGYFKSPDLVGSGHKLVNVTDIYQDFGIDITLSSVERVIVPEKDYKKYSLAEGDIVFTRSSLVLEGIAHCNIINSLPEPAVFECHVMRLRPDKKKVAPIYLSSFCRMPIARSYLMSIAKQVTMATVSQPDVEKMIVAYPQDLAEQEIISNRIKDFDLALKSEEYLLAKMMILKKGLMQDLVTGKVDVKVDKDE